MTGDCMTGDRMTDSSRLLFQRPSDRGRGGQVRSRAGRWPGEGRGQTCYRHPRSVLKLVEVGKLGKFWHMRPSEFWVAAVCDQRPGALSLLRAVVIIFLLSPKGIMGQLELRKSDYRNTVAYGHFDRNAFTWEWLNTTAESLDKAEISYALN